MYKNPKKKMWFRNRNEDYNFLPSWLDNALETYYIKKVKNILGWWTNPQTFHDFDPPQIYHFQVFNDPSTVSFIYEEIVFGARGYTSQRLCDVYERVRFQYGRGVKGIRLLIHTIQYMNWAISCRIEDNYKDDWKRNSLEIYDYINGSGNKDSIEIINLSHILSIFERNPYGGGYQDLKIDLKELYNKYGDNIKIRTLVKKLNAGEYVLEPDEPKIPAYEEIFSKNRDSREYLNPDDIDHTSTMEDLKNLFKDIDFTAPIEDEDD